MPRIVLVIPAYNEEPTIAEVIASYHAVKPDLEIIVVDNNSADGTSRVAKETLARLGAKGQVLFEGRQGKGIAMRTAFTSCDADVYIMIDADTTYHADDLDKLLGPVLQGRCDMAVGDRHKLGDYAKENSRNFHGFGNALVRYIINKAFRANLGDILSGYRVFNRRFVRSFPILYSGFQLETELTLHALDKRLSLLEVPIKYTDRPPGNASKLNTFRDGARVLVSIFNIFRYYRPIWFFGALSFAMFVAGLVVGFPTVREYMLFRYVYSVPSAILAVGLEVLAILLFAIAVILDAGVQQHRSVFELHLMRLEAESVARRQSDGQPL